MAVKQSKEQSVGIRLPTPLYNKVVSLANRQDKYLSAVVRDALYSHLGIPNPAQKQPKPKPQTRKRLV